MLGASSAAGPAAASAEWTTEAHFTAVEKGTQTLVSVKVVHYGLACASVFAGGFEAWKQVQPPGGKKFEHFYTRLLKPHMGEFPHSDISVKAYDNNFKTLVPRLLSETDWRCVLGRDAAVEAALFDPSDPAHDPKACLKLMRVYIGFHQIATIQKLNRYCSPKPL